MPSDKGPKGPADYRSADTGKFVKKGFADRNPKTTVKEHNRPSPKSPPPSKPKR